jgi:hypothetical protein
MSTEPERRAHAFLGKLLNGSKPWLRWTPIVVQPRLLPAPLGPVDFWLYSARVLVEVDGPQHRGEDYKGTSAEQQAAKDIAKEEAAKRHGYHVVRLDDNESDEAWAARLKQALWEAYVRAPARAHVSNAHLIYRLSVVLPLGAGHDAQH